MSSLKKGKKKTKTSRPDPKHRGVDNNLSDITLSDYANSTESYSGRLCKAKTSLNIVCKVEKKLSNEEKALDEKLEELELDKEEDEGQEVSVTKKFTRRKKTLSESIKEPSCRGKTYPIDIWHLISNYIRPEDTAVFSAICNASYRVVNSPIFWMSLYKRHYKNVANLPARLQPECMMRHHGLKACVIRSMFYMYPPLAGRINQRSMNSPSKLHAHQCVSAWQEKINNKWRLCFKMRSKDSHQNKTSNGKKLVDILEDIFANPDEGCTIMQVLSSEKTFVPAVIGLALHSFQMSMDYGSSVMHVQLVFGSGRICNGHLDTTGTVALSLKTVLQIDVLDWWHPRYPHSFHTNIPIPCADEDS